MNPSNLTLAHNTLQRRDRLVRTRSELLDSMTRGDPVAISVGNVYRSHSGATVNPTSDDMPILTDILRGILDRQIAQAEAHLKELGVTDDPEFAEVEPLTKAEPDANARVVTREAVEANLRAAGFSVIRLDEPCNCQNCKRAREAAQDELDRP